VRLRALAANVAVAASRHGLTVPRLASRCSDPYAPDMDTSTFFTVADLRRLLTEHPVDPDWALELAELRVLVQEP
jgi:hypothetical protein